MAESVDAVLERIEERAARRCYRRIYAELAWESASVTGRETAFHDFTAEDVLCVLETMLGSGDLLTPDMVLDALRPMPSGSNAEPVDG